LRIFDVNFFKQRIRLRQLRRDKRLQVRSGGSHALGFSLVFFSFLRFFAERKWRRSQTVRYKLLLRGRSAFARFGATRGRSAFAKPSVSARLRRDKTARQGRQSGQSKWVKVGRAKNFYFLADPPNPFKDF
jgi:hypothetical protein